MGSFKRPFNQVFSVNLNILHQLNIWPSQNSEAIRTAHTALMKRGRSRVGGYSSSAELNRNVIVWQPARH